MSESKTAERTQVLSRLVNGDRTAAGQLFPAVYTVRGLISLYEHKDDEKNTAHWSCVCSSTESEANRRSYPGVGLEFLDAS